MFEGIIGHSRLLAALGRDLENDALSHAILISGPEGVGKTTVAVSLAEAMVGAAAWPGGGRNHPDVWIEDSDTERIGINVVRASGQPEQIGLQDFFSRRSYGGGRRAAVVARAERMTDQAANALLKTLEEPPAGSHIILCAASPERLPQTIVSRCQQYTMSTVEHDPIVRWLIEERQSSPSDAEAAAAIASGRPGVAIRLVEDGEGLRAQLAALERFEAAADLDVAGLMELAGALAPQNNAAGREVALVHLGTWSSFVRDAICFSQGLQRLATWKSYSPQLERWAQRFGTSHLTDMLGRLNQTVESISVYANPRLAYEVLFLDLFMPSAVRA